jgi:hypothetical protein
MKSRSVTQSRLLALQTAFSIELDLAFRFGSKTSTVSLGNLYEGPWQRLNRYPKLDTSIEMSVMIILLCCWKQGTIENIFSRTNGTISFHLNTKNCLVTRDGWNECKLLLHCQI